MSGLNDSFFESSTTDDAITETTPAVETKTESVATDTQIHKEEQKVDNAETTAAEKEASKTGTVPIAALHDERNKRQKYEQELKELKAKFEQQSNPSSAQQNKQEETPPDFYDKPDERFAFEQKKFEEKLLTERIRMSAALVSAQKTDYVERRTLLKKPLRKTLH
jgi:hypothetical protein